MKITITEQQLKILTERNLTDNSPNIGVGGTMALIGVRTVPTEEKNELGEEEPLDKKSPTKTAKEKTIRRSDMDRSRRRPYSPSARFRAS
tara:strand:- start:269 stop:538 length:270 start_codon:yes stop_codon:yes gene_type:complete